MSKPELLAVSDLNPEQLEELRQDYNARNGASLTVEEIKEAYKDSLFIKAREGATR